MNYYTERHGIRKPIQKTYDISIDMYVALFTCCQKFYDHLAWKFSILADDGRSRKGFNREEFEIALKYEIPNLFRDEYGNSATPKSHYNIFEKEAKQDKYDQYALLDYIEYFSKNCRNYQPVYNDNNECRCLSFSSSSNKVFKKFQKEINYLFEKMGLLYSLNDNREIERVPENSVLTKDIENQIDKIGEKGLREKLQDAIALYKTPNPSAREDSVEKIWDALERLKTYYANMDKKASVEKIVSDMSNNQKSFKELFDDEFRTLTSIGNDFRIRHHETNKIDITDIRYYDYFFNRCLSLIALAIQYLK